jgi:hypothetical protein
MTPSIGVTVAVVGALFILIGLVGGDLSYKGFRVPKVGALPRFTTSAFGILILGLGVFVALAVELESIEKQRVAHERPEPNPGPELDTEAEPEPGPEAEPEPGAEPERGSEPGTATEPDLTDEDGFRPWLAPGPASGAAADTDGLPGGLEADLEVLFGACHGWDFAACDELYRVAPHGSDAELFGGTCGGWLLDGVSGGCAELEYLGELLLACQEGDGFACDELYELAPLGSALEQFAASCGWRYVAPVAGTCSLGT